MFFSIIGVGLVAYGCMYAVATIVFDCDLQLGLLEIFGKSPRRLKGKVAFITGASSGIGEHTAYALAKAGVKLILTARRNLELQRVKQQCVEVANGQLDDKDVLVIPMDVLDMSSHRTHFQHALRHFGTVDILVNNAGRSQRALFDETELAVDRQVFELNVFAVINLTRVALEHFNQRGQGHVVAVSSVAGVVDVPFSASYTASKHTLHAYFNCLRVEKTGTNIHVTLLCPGPVFTNFLSEAFTNKEGEKLHGSVSATDRRMTAKRCGHLNAVAIVNKVGEAWMAKFPVVPMAYIGVYFPLLFKLALRLVGPEKLFAVRDSKEFDPTETKAQ